MEWILVFCLLVLSGICQYFYLAFTILLRNALDSHGVSSCFMDLAWASLYWLSSLRDWASEKLVFRSPKILACRCYCRFAVSGCLLPPSALGRLRRGEAGLRSGREGDSCEGWGKWNIGTVCPWLSFFGFLFLLRAKHLSVRTCLFILVPSFFLQILHPGSWHYTEVLDFINNTLCLFY